MLKPAVLAEQRQRLIEMGRRIEREFDQHAEAIAQDIVAPGNLSHLPTHPADKDVEGIDVELAVGQTQDELLKAILAALKAIDQGTYGQCEKCGQPIPEERLRAVPYAVRCVDCQRED